MYFIWLHFIFVLHTFHLAFKCIPLNVANFLFQVIILMYISYFIWHNIIIIHVFHLDDFNICHFTWPITKTTLFFCIYFSLTSMIYVDDEWILNLQGQGKQKECNGTASAVWFDSTYIQNSHCSINLISCHIFSCCKFHGSSVMILQIFLVTLPLIIDQCKSILTHIYCFHWIERTLL